jgi:hypothetical protein
MRNIEKKYPASLQDGGLNSDSADFAVGINQVVNATNVRWGSTDAGVTDVVEEIGGTRQISESQPSVTFMTIGSAEDIENNRLLFFKFCTTAPWHRITCYDKDADTEYVVLLATQVTGGLNFSKYSPIHSARVINGLLIWTDAQDTQHKINIDAGIKLNNPSYNTDQAAYVLPINSEVVSLIKRPPRFPLSVVQITLPSIVQNFIGRNAFWFGYRYTFRDKETSVVSIHSPIIPYNAADQSYNAIDITISLSELIDQDVQRVEIGVRIDNNPQFFGVKAWDKALASDLAQIQAHNAGTTALSFRFFNNRVGEPWGDAYSVKPFESCPIRSKTLELVRNRVHLANNTSGYTAPLATSLVITGFTEEQGATVEGDWFELKWEYIDVPGIEYTYYYLKIQGIGSQSGYYEGPDGVVVTPPPPTSVDFNDMVFAGTTLQEILDFIGSGGINVITWNGFGTTATVSYSPTGTVDITNGMVYKTNSPYIFGVVFFDEYDRKCGVVSTSNQIYDTEDREYDSVTFSTFANWTLNNTNRLTEIPDWAISYAVVRTKCLRTRYFLQARARDITYATFDEATSEYVFNIAAYDNTLKGVGIRIDALNSFGMGYLYEEANNDIVKVWIDGTVTPYFLRIIAQQGDWIVGQLADLGTLSDQTPPKTDTFFEIYTPYQQQSNEPFYEVGAKYLITNPKTSSRTYSVLADAIRGDSYLLQRAEGGNTYYTEAMSLNDKFYQNWFDDSGRINLIDRIGQKYEPNSIVYSNTFILGSNINGLCEFEALNEAFVPYECGQIQKLQVTSKVQNEQGSIMLAICQAQTASIYIGEVQLLGSSGNAFVAQSAGVIGTINVLKGNYGTINPESATEYRGTVFYVDASNGRVIQYSSNGLFPISQYGMSRFWRLFCQQYVRMTPAQIEAFGSRPYIFTTVDPYHNELLITIPQVLANPPAGYLPDYPLINNPFDIYDGEAKTVVYKIGVGEGNPYWMGSTQYTPEWLATLQNELYSSKNGILWQHNQVNYCNFYGTQYKPSLAVISNSFPSAVKVFNALSVEANKTPIWVYMYALSPNQQATDLMDYEWQNLEGMLYAAIKRDKITPTAQGYTTTALLTGETIRTHALKIYFEFSGGIVPLQLRFININFDISRGHSTFQR